MSGVQFLSTVVRYKDGGAWGRLDLRDSGSSPVNALVLAVLHIGDFLPECLVHGTAFLSKNVWPAQHQGRTKRGTCVVLGS